MLRFPANPFVRHLVELRSLPVSAVLTKTTAVTISVLCNMAIGGIVIAVFNLLSDNCVNLLERDRSEVVVVNSHIVLRRKQYRKP